MQVGTEKFKARARTAKGEERADRGKRRWSSGRPTPITRRRPSARSPWSCSTRCADIKKSPSALPGVPRLPRNADGSR